MPTYSFKNTKTGEEFTELMGISEKEKYLKKNKHIQQMVTSINIISGTGYNSRIKNDSGWKELQSKIAERNPGSAFAQKHGKRSIKDIKTRQVLQKHKILPKD
tara:strand:- start:773 stop:1081 length:309 start_codon:yes stop_codon:yes gene_type:complete